VNLEMLREATKQQKPAERLVTRLAQLREMLHWADAVTEPENAQNNRLWQSFLTQRDLAHKILDEQEHPSGGDRTLSATDPDARRAKHGQWFNGYLTDILVDADSEMITAVNVMPAIGNEAADALELIRQEEAAHGNDIVALSMDGAGFKGPVLRELENPDGLKVETYVPPPKEPETGLFTQQDFVEDKERGVMTCPAGQTSTSRFRDKQKQVTKYRFAASICRVCPLLARCMKVSPGRHGRTVCKSDYQVEHERVRQRATTPQYAAVRKRNKRHGDKSKLFTELQNKSQ
jgi:hypothetical protein